LNLLDCSKSFWKLLDSFKLFYTTVGAFGRFLDSLKCIEGFGLHLKHLKTYALEAYGNF